MVRKLTVGKWYFAKKDFQLPFVSNYVYTMIKKGEGFELVDFGRRVAVIENSKGESARMSEEVFKEMFEELEE